MQGQNKIFRGARVKKIGHPWFRDWPASCNK